MNDVTLTINGKLVPGVTEPRVTLLDFLRDVAGLKGTHAGCEHGVCGACTVLIDGTAVRSCLMVEVEAEGEDMSTVEGIGGSGERAGERVVDQEGFCETRGLQGGDGTPGMSLAAEALLSVNTDPTEHEVREAISGNICRCTGYVQIVDAILLAAKRLGQRNDAAPSDTNLV